MPQLDKVSFLSQLSYFFLLFFSSYFLLVKKYLPSILWALKLRKELIKGLKPGDKKIEKKRSEKKLIVKTAPLTLAKLISYIVTKEEIKRIVVLTEKEFKKEVLRGKLSSN